MTSKCADNSTKQSKMYEFAERFKVGTKLALKARVLRDNLAARHGRFEITAAVYIKLPACGTWNCVRR